MPPKSKLFECDESLNVLFCFFNPCLGYTGMFDMTDMYNGCATF